MKKNQFKADVFYTNYVASHRGIFDDKFNKDVKFWGSYLTKNEVFKNHGLDVYYLGIWKRIAVLNDARGKEVRHSVGTRFWNSKNNWLYDFEAIYQFGNIDHKEISAWTASIKTTYKFDAIKFKPTIGLKTEIISGDRRIGDNKIQTFNPLYAMGGYFGLAALIGPSNIIDIHPSLNMTLLKSVNFEIDYDIFCRYRAQDGIYRANSSLIYSDGDTNAKRIGNQLTAAIMYEPNGFFYMRAEMTSFKPGNYLKAVGPGKNLLFLGLTTQFKF